MILMVKEIKEQIRHNVLEVDESLSMINSITRLPIATVQRANHSFFQYQFVSYGIQRFLRGFREQIVLNLLIFLWRLSSQDFE